MSNPREIVRQHGLDPDKLPRHVAIVMDGNGRWARERGLERIEGHLRGVEVVRKIVTECCQLGLDCLTLYCFSAENWKRPERELSFLMALLKSYLIDEREVLAEIDETTRLSARNQGLTLQMAINYGSRQEIVDAVKTIARDVMAGTLPIDAIDESIIGDRLNTAGQPDPDLMIRTAGEWRISNFLLWQISYSELWVTPTRWPDFDAALLHQAFRDYASRDRRFGGLNTRPEPPC
jgi:undecaprenyl diphosphate synthase